MEGLPVVTECDGGGPAQALRFKRYVTMSNESPQSKAGFYVSSYFENIGRVMIAVGADFTRPNVWIAESCVLFPKAGLSSSLRVRTSCESAEKYAPWLPSADEVIADRFNYALSVFWSRLRKEDAELARALREMDNPFNGPLTDKALAQVHFSGEFGDQIVDLIRFTECDAMRDTLREFERLPKFKTKTESLQQ